jgi:hypothetical protein
LEPSVFGAVVVPGASACFWHPKMESAAMMMKPVRSEMECMSVTHFTVSRITEKD